MWWLWVGCSLRELAVGGQGARVGGTLQSNKPGGAGLVGKGRAEREEQVV